MSQVNETIANISEAGTNTFHKVMTTRLSGYNKQDPIIENIDALVSAHAQIIYDLCSTNDGMALVGKNSTAMEQLTSLLNELQGSNLSDEANKSVSRQIIEEMVESYSMSKTHTNAQTALPSQPEASDEKRNFVGEMQKAGCLKFQKQTMPICTPSVGRKTDPVKEKIIADIARCANHIYDQKTIGTEDAAKTLAQQNIVTIENIARSIPHIDRINRTTDPQRMKIAEETIGAMMQKYLEVDDILHPPLFSAEQVEANEKITHNATYQGLDEIRAKLYEQMETHALDETREVDRLIKQYAHTVTFGADEILAAGLANRLAEQLKTIRDKLPEEWAAECNPDTLTQAITERIDGYLAKEPTVQIEKPVDVMSLIPEAQVHSKAS